MNGDIQVIQAIFIHCKLCKNFLDRIHLKKEKASCGKFSIKRWDALHKSNMRARPLNRKSTYQGLKYGKVILTFHETKGINKFYNLL